MYFVFAYIPSPNTNLMFLQQFCDTSYIFSMIFGHKLRLNVIHPSFHVITLSVEQQCLEGQIETLSPNVLHKTFLALNCEGIEDKQRSKTVPDKPAVSVLSSPHLLPPVLAMKYSTVSPSA